MTVGESLAQVRDTAGLSVDEVSGRTGIRETVIRAIERDDFDALGGDLYVRGYLRAITAALGIDPQPLIREFDAARAASGAPASALPSLAPAAEAPEAEAPAAELPAGEDYSSPWWADDAVSDADPLPVTEGGPDIDGTAPWASAPEPAHRSRPDDFAPAGRTVPPGRTRPAGTAATRTATRARPAPRKRSRPGRRSRVRGWRWATTVAVFAAVVLAIVGVATSQIVSKLSSPGHAAATAKPTVRAAAADGSPTASAPAASQAADPTPTPTATATQSPAVRLAIAAASAFGPDGVADGDNAQSAANVITPGSSRPWLTDWYATATFGMLKTGTGLLLDMGRTVTVTSVQVRLGGVAGADLQVRAGNAASLSGTRVVASARNAGGTLVLRLKAPARVRYIIIWFTGLPPSGSGNYQATVHSVTVMGRR